MLFLAESTFLPQITLGNILTVITFLGGILAAWFQMQRQISLLDQRFTLDSAALEKRLTNDAKSNADLYRLEASQNSERNQYLIEEIKLNREMRAKFADALTELNKSAVSCASILANLEKRVERNERYIDEARNHKRRES